MIKQLSLFNSILLNFDFFLKKGFFPWYHLKVYPGLQQTLIMESFSTTTIFVKRSIIDVSGNPKYALAILGLKISLQAPSKVRFILSLAIHP